MRNKVYQRQKPLMTEILPNGDTATWVEAELRLSGIDGRMIALLKAIAASGSINQAARQVGLSYKGAWQIIERANNLAPKVLVATATGGSKGGGTSLTAAGRSLLNLFASLEDKHRQFLRELNRNLVDDADLMLLLKRLDVKTSADNQLFGHISKIQMGEVNAEVFVTQKGGQQIVASITLAAVKQLDLRIGTDAVMLINSSDIILATELDDCRLSARNRLGGTIMRIQNDGVNAEIVIRLSGGDTFIVTVTQQSAANLGLEPGMQICAVFKSNAVMLGVADAQADSGELSAQDDKLR
jgi:molybdate transport system regulatory protein